MPRPVTIKTWAKLALEDGKRQALDVKKAKEQLARLRAQKADPDTIRELEKRIAAMEKRARDALR